MNREVDKKVALVTGSSSGLGQALVLKLLQRGYRVYGGLRNTRKLPTIPGDEFLKDNLAWVKLDIENEKSCQEVVKKIILKEGKIDVLINNAAVTLIGSTIQFTIKDLQHLLRVNVLGAFRLIKEVIPQMLKQCSGRVINITSLNGLVSFPNFGLYSSSKFALEALSNALHYELAGHNVYVTSVAPGAFKRTSGSAKRELPHIAAREKFVLLKYLLPIMEIDQVAEAVCVVAESPNPPMRAILGRDTKLVLLAQRVLGNSLFEKLMKFVWERK